MKRLNESLYTQLRTFVEEFAKNGTKSSVKFPTLSATDIGVVERLCLPFLRRVSLVLFCCLEKSKPSITDTYSKSEFQLLLQFLNLPTLDVMLKNLWSIQFPYTQIWLQHLLNHKHANK
jgi:hypothetical protein